MMADTPHIVKFSGGRSSGMMLMQLLRQRKLKAARGDVVVFNNTSAEHSATYDFTRKMKAETEKRGIPFFWIEFQTYETSSDGYWTRKPTYRLVNDRPYSDKNVGGYRHQGEVFEEMISMSGYVPNIRERTCTAAMKIFVTNAFLSDWFVQASGIRRQGHHFGTPQMSDADVVAIHKKRGGKTPHKILLKKKAFIRKCIFYRPEQSWRDFVSCKLRVNNPGLKESVVGEKAQLYGDLAIDYVSYLGIRKDEQIRIGRINSRIQDAQGSKVTSLFNQPPGETVCAPLIDGDVRQEDVVKFWDKQPFDLDLPKSGLYSNCVYCPIKGKARLLAIAQDEFRNGRSNVCGPASIKWWQRIEKIYSRDLIAEGREITSDQKIKFYGFFGPGKEMVYSALAKRAKSAKNGDVVESGFLNDNFVPCSCTD